MYWLVQFTTRDIDSYAYEVENEEVAFYTEKEANDFYNDLPEYIKKINPNSRCESRQKPVKINMLICNYDHEKMRIF